MYDNADQLRELEELVDLTLKQCDPANVPHVCAMNATPEGRATVREAVLRICINQGLAPGPAMVEYERECDPNEID